VGFPNGLIPFLAELLGLFVQLGLALGELLREGFQLTPGLRCLSFGTSDAKIVRAIPASRLA
jgi:hypothetical protein